MPQFLAPVGNDQFIDANGDPLTGGQIETYLEGSSTPAATYTSSSGAVAQANPIILNSLGYAPSPVWLTGGIGYKFIVKDAGGSTLRTIDNISGINDASVSQSEWVESGLVPTYISATSFSVPGDQTPTLQINRRLRTTNTSGLVFSTISNSVFAAGITTVTVTNDSTTLDAGLSLVAYALLAASPVSVPNLPGSKITGAITASAMTMATNRLLGRVTASTGAIEELAGAAVQNLLPIQQARVDVASASTVDLTSSVPSNDHINITGTTTITAFTVAAGRLLFVRFNAALTLTNNASIVTQRGANITTAAGDTCVLRATAANVVEVLFYQEGRWGLAPGSAPLYAVRAWVNFNGVGTVAIRASGNVSSITDLGLGAYRVNFTTAMPDANYATNVTAAVASSSNAYGYLVTSAGQVAGSVEIGVGNTGSSTVDSDLVCVTVVR